MFSSMGRLDDLTDDIYPQPSPVIAFWLSLSIRGGELVILSMDERNRERDIWKESRISISHINFVGATYCNERTNGGEWRGIRESLRWNGSIVQQGSIYCGGSYTAQGIFFRRLTSVAVGTGILSSHSHFIHDPFRKVIEVNHPNGAVDGWGWALELAPEHMFVAHPHPLEFSSHRR